MADEMKKWENKELASENGILAQYLQTFELPIDNIIASYDDREMFTDNFPRIMGKLDKNSRENARYLSKFAIASSIGLFDAAVNYIWNEVILNLRKKAVHYGLDAFFTEAVGGDLRENYKSEEDLAALKDSVLLDTCNKLEILSPIVYVELDHILTMRNHFAASHPNSASINGSKLISWLETCAKDVIKDGPSEDAIYLSSTIRNIKSYNGQMDDATVAAARERFSKFSTPHINNLAATLFGIYVDQKTDQNQRLNVLKLAPLLWSLASEEGRTLIASNVDKYRSQFDQGKVDRALEFLKMVGGSSFETLPSKIISLNKLIDRLKSAHENRDNFYTEPPIMREILEYIKDSNDIPVEISQRLILTVMRCRIGRGLDYCQGVSPNGRPLYDQFFSLLDDKNIVIAIDCLFLPEINSKLSSEYCKNHLKQVLDIFYSHAISSRLKEAIEFLSKDVSKAVNADKRKEFKNIFDPLRS